MAAFLRRKIPRQIPTGEVLLRSLAHFFFALGGMGVLLLGALDSSFLLFLPLGNDCSWSRSRLPAANT
jgi:hypothetical protein